MGCMRNHFHGHPVPLRPAWTQHVDKSLIFFYLSYNIAYCVIVSPARLTHILNHVHHASALRSFNIGVVGEGMLEDCGWFSAATIQHRLSMYRATDHFEKQPIKLPRWGLRCDAFMSLFHCYIQTPQWVMMMLSTSIFHVMASSSIHSPPTTDQTPVVFLSGFVGYHQKYLYFVFFSSDMVPLTASQRSSAESLFYQHMALAKVGTNGHDQTG